jgi:hypothetical protein
MGRSGKEPYIEHLFELDGLDARNVSETGGCFDPGADVCVGGQVAGEMAGFEAGSRLTRGDLLKRSLDLKEFTQVICSFDDTPPEIPVPVECVDGNEALTSLVSNVTQKGSGHHLVGGALPGDVHAWVFEVVLHLQVLVRPGQVTVVLARVVSRLAPVTHVEVGLRLLGNEDTIRQFEMKLVLRLEDGLQVQKDGFDEGTVLKECLDGFFSQARNVVGDGLNGFRLGLNLLTFRLQTFSAEAVVAEELNVSVLNIGGRDEEDCVTILTVDDSLVTELVPIGHVLGGSCSCNHLTSFHGGHEEPFHPPADGVFRWTRTK